MSRPPAPTRPVRTRLLRGAVGAVASVGAVAGLSTLAGSTPVALTAASTAAPATTAAPVTLTADLLVPTSGGTGAERTGLTAADLAARTPTVSRAADRASVTGERETVPPATEEPGSDPAREAVLSTGTAGVGVTVAEDLTTVDPRGLARRLMPTYGLPASQFGCLDSLWNSESGWNMHADNPTSTAYGIPQALMSAWDLPADYTTNPETQIRWGLWYIEATYGSACNAWSFKQANNWY